jgi:hypothetical protein
MSLLLGDGDVRASGDADSDLSAVATFEFSWLGLGGVEMWLASWCAGARMDSGVSSGEKWLLRGKLRSCDESNAEPLESGASDDDSRSKREM